MWHSFFSLFSDWLCQECADFTVVIHSSVRNKLLVDTWGRLSRWIHDTYEGILREFGFFYFFLQSNSFIKCLQFPVKRDKGAHIFVISRLTSLHAGLPSSALACIVSSLRLNLRVPSPTAQLFAAICLFSAQACRRTMAPMLATLTLACLGIKTAIVHIFFYVQLRNASKCVHALGLGRTCSVAWPQFDFFLSAAFRRNFFPGLRLFTVNLFVFCGFSHHPLMMKTGSTLSRL